MSQLLIALAGAFLGAAITTRWVTQHHRCTLCGLWRPAWMRGNHTACIELRLEELRRQELAR